MNKLLATLSLCLIPALALAAVETPPTDSNRIKDVLYNADDVYTITTKYGYQTNIVFGEGEEIQTISVGDRSMWQIIPSANRLFIRPMEDNVDTNMTVLTNRRSYQFDLRSVGPKDQSNVYVIRFVYQMPRPPASRYVPAKYTPVPAPPLPPAPPKPVAPPKPAAAPKPAATHKPANSPSSLNMNYTYTGNDALAPLNVGDNGSFTFMKYREGQQLPSVYALDKKGGKHAVSYIFQNNLMVIKETAPQWLLEYPSGTVHIYNEKVGK